MYIRASSDSQSNQPLHPEAPGIRFGEAVRFVQDSWIFKCYLYISGFV